MMSNRYVFYGLIITLVVLIAGAGGSVYFANNLLAKQSAKLTDLKIQADALSTKKVSLAQAQKDIAKYSSLETIARSVVPQDKDQAEAVREIVNIAESSNVSLSNITFSPSTLGATKALPTTGGAAPTTTPVAGASNKLTQVTPVVGIPGVYDLQINLATSTDNPVSYTNFITFLQKLEDNRRTAQVSSINLQPDAKNRSLLNFTLSIDEYLKP